MVLPWPLAWRRAALMPGSCPLPLGKCDLGRGNVVRSASGPDGHSMPGRPVGSTKKLT